jgi:ABC-2 type transport system ATP-binding protein
MWSRVRLSHPAPPRPRFTKAQDEVHIDDQRPWPGETAPRYVNCVVGDVITVEGLQKRYGDFVAVEDVSFHVEQGEIFGILGPNGAGKTTTIECVQGLRTADGGDVRVLGLDPRTQVAALRQRIGAQLQDSALPGRLTVAEALDLFGVFADKPVRADDLIERWRLEGQRDQSFDSLSGGQRQRLFIALAFVNSPEVVFLDELTQGLDPEARRGTWELIREIRAGGTTVVLVTHFMDEAEHLCDRLAVVDAGRIIALDTPAGLIDGAGMPSVVRFTTDEPDLQWLEALEVVDSVERSGASGISVSVRGHGPVLALVAAELVAHGVVPTDLRVERPTLEDAFLRLAGRREFS